MFWSLVVAGFIFPRDDHVMTNGNSAGSMMAHDKRHTASIGLSLIGDLAAEPKRYTVWDDALKGFGIRVSPNGVKTYIVRYRIGGGRRGTLKQLTIGSATTLTPTEARKSAKNALAAVVHGNDPQGDKRKQREELTVGELCDEYMGDVTGAGGKKDAGGIGHKKPSTVAGDRFRIARHIRPLIGKVKLSQVDRTVIERMKHDIASGRVGDDNHPLTRGGQSAATRTLGLLGAIFGFAISRNLCTKNPVKGVKRFKQEKRERFLSAKEWGALGDALAGLEALGWDKTPLTIFRLLALTGCRKNEIVGLRWLEIDRERSMLRLADSKTGAKVVKLGAPALEVLQDLPENESEFVFPDPRDPKKHYHALNYQWEIARARAGLPDVRIHDLRHSYASVGLAGGAGLPLIAKLLGHANVTTTQRYAHLADDPVRAAADQIAATIDGAMRGVSGELTPMKSR